MGASKMPWDRFRKWLKSGSSRRIVGRYWTCRDMPIGNYLRNSTGLNNLDITGLFFTLTLPGNDEIDKQVFFNPLPKWANDFNKMLFSDPRKSRGVGFVQARTCLDILNKLSRKRRGGKIRNVPCETLCVDCRKPTPQAILDMFHGRCRACYGDKIGESKKESPFCDKGDD